MATTPWSREEDRILAANYPLHGSVWAGWEALLPNRTDKSIRGRAARLGIRSDGYVPSRSGINASVMRLFREGETCSQIDRLLSLPGGKAHDIVVAVWYEEKMRGRG